MSIQLWQMCYFLCLSFFVYPTFNEFHPLLGLYLVHLILSQGQITQLWRIENIPQ